MATSISARLVGNQFLGNTDTTEVHELTRESQCQIAAIAQNDQAVTFSPVTLAQARSEGYDNCHHCIGGSTR